MHYLVLPYFILFVFYFVFIFYKDSPIKYAGIAYFFIVSLLFFYTAMILQPVGGDSFRYERSFMHLGDMTFEQLFNIPKDKPHGNSEYGFRFLNWFFYQIYENYKFFMTGLFIIQIYILYYAIKSLYDSYEKYYVMFLFVLYPYFIAYVISGKRQGLALVLMLLSISFIIKNQKLKGMISLLFIPLFHYGSILIFPFIAIFAYFKEKNIFKISIVIFTISFLLSLSGINQVLMEEIPKWFSLDPQYVAYFETDGEFKHINYRVGFRADFALFSLFPIMLYLLFKSKIEETKKQRVINWLSIYMLLNSIYHLFSMVPFNDRFAAFSWFLLPLVSYEILRAVHKKYAILFSAILLFIGVVLLQVYTRKYFLPLGLIT